MVNKNIALTNDDLFQSAPSIFADKPFIGMSEQYKFIPTIELVETMRNNGFLPVMASQSKTRCVAKQGYQKHMVKFRQDKYIGDSAIVGNEVPEILLVNSHDGGSLYELAMGIFRFICSNGMVVQSASYGNYSVKHNGIIADLIDSTFKIVADFPKAFAQIEQMKALMLDNHRQIILAEKALTVKLPEHDTGIAPSLLLEAKREDDDTVNGERSLWTTFNVIQENIIKGGLEGKSTRTVPIAGTTNQFGIVERKTKSKPIKAIQENLRVNKGLWELASQELLMAA